MPSDKDRTLLLRTRSRSAESKRETIFATALGYAALTGVVLLWLLLLGAGCLRPGEGRSPRPNEAPPRTPAEAARRLCREPPAERTGQRGQRGQRGLRGLRGLRGQHGLRRLFSPEILRAVPLARLRHDMETRQRLYGRCLGVQGLKGPRVVWRFERARILGRIYLDDAHRIAGLWFDDVRVPGDTWARLAADLKKLPGQASLTARAAGGRLLATHQSARALAVASAFKLYVLDTIAREIRAGRMRWDDVVQLRDRWRSLPPAPLNRWPNGAPLTVQSLATWMVTASDNTATDHLLYHVGRRVVESHAGTWNRPLLSTLEMFKLKSPGQRELAERYLKLPLAERRKLLEQIASMPRRRLKIGWKQPRMVDRLEWFFSTRALCEVMLRVKKLPLWGATRGAAFRGDVPSPLAPKKRGFSGLTPNHRASRRCRERHQIAVGKAFGPSGQVNGYLGATRDPANRWQWRPSRRQWRRVAVKGGSEPGVRNLTLALQHRRTERWYCLSVTWNDPEAPLDRPRFDALVARALDLLWQTPATPPDKSPATPPDKTPATPPDKSPATPPDKPPR